MSIGLLDQLSSLNGKKGKVFLPYGPRSNKEADRSQFTYQPQSI